MKIRTNGGEMFETIFLFIALFVLEVVLEIDNLTALQKAAAGLPKTQWCSGQVPHVLALGVRLSLTFLLFHLVSVFAALSNPQGQVWAKQCGGLVLIMVACGLIFSHLRADSASRSSTNLRRPGSQPTSLVNFLLADAFLSLDTVIAAVAMTTNFKLAVLAMVSAAVTIMLFHDQLQAWLKDRPRIALLAFVIIGLLGFNLILASGGIAVPKYVLLAVVLLGVWFDAVDKDMKKMRAVEVAARKQKHKQTRKSVQRETVSDLNASLVTVAATPVAINCPSCNAVQEPNSSLCHACGLYKFFDMAESLQSINLLKTS